jgi:biopolymer transport protein ExbD
MHTFQGHRTKMKKEQPINFRPMSEASLVLSIFFIFIFSIMVLHTFSLPIQSQTIEVYDFDQNPKIDASKTTKIPISHQESLNCEIEEKEENSENLNTQFGCFSHRNKTYLTGIYFSASSCFRSLDIYSHLVEVPLYILFHNLKVQLY